MGTSSAARDPELEKFFAEQGVAFEALPYAEHAKLERAWNDIYADVWRLGLRYKSGFRAERAYGVHGGLFVLVPFLGDRAGPHGVGAAMPRTVAYRCKAPNVLPDFTQFAPLDFFVSPPDLSWTMLYSHEDAAFGCSAGPYYIERDSLVPPTRVAAHRKHNSKRPR